MTGISRIFVCIIFIVDFNRKNNYLCNFGELNGVNTGADQNHVNQNNYLDERPIYDSCEIKKFTPIFNISSTPSLSRLNQIGAVHINSTTGAVMEEEENLEASDAMNWKQITLPTALEKYRDETQVVHCMLWFRTTEPQSHHISYAFLQLRFNGLLGFPGGVIDEDITDIEAIIDGLERELHEEINFRPKITFENYIYSFYNKPKRFVSHFFAKQISLKEAEDLEVNHTKARDFPRESLGLFRIPIGYSCDRNSRQLRRFMRNFMRQKFSGNVRKQIVEVCERFKLMSAQDLEWTKSML